ncbi:MAG: GtrA family protein [Ramlibacter sp.]
MRPMFNRSRRPRNPGPVRQQGRIVWFLLVGTAAAAVHWCVVMLLVRHGEWPPLVANVAGWLVAFFVSFGGHQTRTFRDHGTSLGLSLSRFFAVSAGGFALNEAGYWALMRWGAVRYDTGLAAILLANACITYLLSRHWVFRRKAASPDAAATK